MNLSKLITVAVIGLAALAVACAPAGNHYVDEVGGYEVRFPGPAADLSTTVETPNGPIDHHMRVYRIPGETYTVAYNALPADMADVDALERREGARAQLIESYGAELQSEREIQLGDIKGYELVLTAHDGTQIHTRFFEHAERLYVLSARIEPGEAESRRTAFLESFRLQG